MSQRNTFNYNLKFGRKIVYKGTTNDIERRLREHDVEGKVFTHIQQTGRTKTESGAKREERRQLRVYRKNHGGRNPKYNRSRNG